MDNENGATRLLVWPGKNGRGARIRTEDFLLPKQARYRAAPRPDKRVIIPQELSAILFAAAHAIASAFTEH